jgi:membrane-bound lytic murein transglycosylase D
MTIFRLVSLAVAVGLAGCASLGNDSASPPQKTWQTWPGQTAAAAPPFVLTPEKIVKALPEAKPAITNEPTKPTLAPVIPSGRLKPITAVETEAQQVASLTPPVDLWARIRRGFAMPNLESTLVQDREQWYSTRPDYIQRMTERSSKYLFHIVEELERRNMPSELALLPFIESAFNPQAVSSAKAAGMWQFMPATGKAFELKQNAFRDDRRDVLASTRAALDYLQKLYGMFDNWHLALAAYNWGEGNVRRAIAKNKRQGLPTNYEALSMPLETQLYVPKLQAVKNIVLDPEALRVSLPVIGNHPYFQSVSITKDIDVALAAKLAEVSLEDFKALNPSAKRPLILAAGTPQILLPWDNAAVFRNNLQNYSGRLASWTVWRAPQTLRPQAVAQRVGMSEEELRRVNNIPPRMLIKVGSSLLVPRSAKSEHDVAEHVADNGQLSLAPEVTLRRIVVKARRNDTAVSIAKRYGVQPQLVAQWNKLAAPSVFKTGQSVVLYVPPRANQARGKSAKKPAATRPSATYKPGNKPKK